jgi:hypothetical protein
MELSMSLALADHADGGKGMRRLVDGLTHREPPRGRLRRVGARALIVFAAWLDPTCPLTWRETPALAPAAH